MFKIFIQIRPVFYNLLLNIIILSYDYVLLYITKRLVIDVHYLVKFELFSQDELSASNACINNLCGGYFDAVTNESTFLYSSET